MILGFYGLQIYLLHNEQVKSRLRANFFFTCLSLNELNETLNDKQEKYEASCIHL